MEFSQFSAINNLQKHILIHIHSITTTIKMIVFYLGNKMTLFVFK
jgi:hypothetical protein